MSGIRRSCVLTILIKRIRLKSSNRRTIFRGDTNLRIHEPWLDAGPHSRLDEHFNNERSARFFAAAE